MDFEDRLYDFILSEVDDQTNPPGRYNIERGGESIWKHGEEGEILVTASWWEDADEDSEFDVGGWNRYFISLSEDDDFFDELNTVFNTVRDRVQVTDENTTLGKFSWSRNTHTDANEDLSIEFEWTGESDLPFNAFMALEQEKELSENGESVLESICKELSSQFDDTVTSSDVNKLDLLYSDFHYCGVDSVQIDFDTRHPHKYYDVSSLEEYVGVVADDESEVDDLLSQQTYSISLPFGFEGDDDEVGVIFSKSLRETVEDLMRARIDTMVTVDGPYSYEAEAIVFNDGVETTNFWLRPYFDVAEILDEDKTTDT